MASIKAIRRRIASVKSTQQITRAMKLIAAARLRRAQEALLSARPYAETLARVAESLLESEKALLEPREEARAQSLIVVIASDRGLCGAYNSNAVRKGEEIARHQVAANLAPAYFPVGRKAVEHFKRAKVSIGGESVGNQPLATVKLARAIGTRMLSDYLSGAVRETGIIYSRFKSALAQTPVYERVLPLPSPEELKEQHGPEVVEYLIEPSRSALVPIVLQSYVESAVFHALLEAEASDNAAKMTAMDAATNNAEEMITQYTLEMNRARQAAITSELMDIVGGSEALRE
ncbi:MAG TPA: ATP synthase F1 subunit gamma [Candidatus Binataceae bacterium]